MDTIWNWFGGGEKTVATAVPTTPNLEEKTNEISQNTLNNTSSPSSVPDLNKQIDKNKIEVLPSPDKNEKFILLDDENLVIQNPFSTKDDELKKPSPPKNDTPLPLDTETDDSSEKKEGCCTTHAKTFTIASVAIAMSVAAAAGLMLSRKWHRQF